MGSQAEPHPGASELRADKRKEAAARRREAKAQAVAEKKAQAEAQKKAQADVVVGAAAPAAKRQKLSKAPMPTPVTQRMPRLLDDSDLDSD